MTKETTPKQDLDKAASNFRKLQAAEKAKVSPPTPAKEIAVDSVEPPAIVELDKSQMQEVLARCVQLDEGNTSVRLIEETTPAEYLLVLDFFTHQSRFSVLQLGDVANAAPKILGAKYQSILAATGRSYDSVKKAAWVAREIPWKLRNRHKAITPTHLSELAGLPNLEDKQNLVEKLVAAAEEGKPITTKEIRAEVENLMPVKPSKPAKKVSKPDAETPYVMSGDEQPRLNQLLADVEDIAQRVREKEYQFILMLPDDETEELRKSLATIQAFNIQLMP